MLSVRENIQLGDLLLEVTIIQRSGDPRIGKDTIMASFSYRLEEKYLKIPL
jgi:hypothetical protein